MEIVCEWTGRYPNLCRGEWRLSIDGGDVSDTIPFQGEPAMTRGKHQHWHFENWSEVFEDYEDGIGCVYWMERHYEWLASIAPLECWPLIYDAFQAHDWRHGECWGCI